jgi:hypothetical protein
MPTMRMKFFPQLRTVNSGLVLGGLWEAFTKFAVEAGELGGGRRAGKPTSGIELPETGSSLPKTVQIFTIIRLSFGNIFILKAK